MTKADVVNVSLKIPRHLADDIERYRAAYAERHGFAPSKTDILIRAIESLVEEGPAPASSSRDG